MSPSSTAWNGCLLFQPGFCGASALTRAKMKANWTYIGCSHHSVPSLSKVAMRWSGGTKSGPPLLVTRATKLVIDVLVAPSFHDGSGSPCACATPSESDCSGTLASTPASAVRRVSMVRFMAMLLLKPSLTALELPRPESLLSCPEATEMINGGAGRRECERLKRFREHLLQVILSCDANGDVRVEILAA